MADKSKQPAPEEMILKGEDEIEDVVELADGSAVVSLPDDEDETESKEFLENLADVVDESQQRTLTTTLLDLIENDKQARSKRDEKYQEGIRRTGLGDDAPGGASFEGSSKVVHPILAESCIDFESRAIKELFPANGPVKTQIIGKRTEEKLARADRKAKYLNWQLTKQMEEYRPTLEQVLMQVPMGGSQYEKFFYDPKFKRPRTCFVPVDDMLLPFNCTSFYTASRMTHVMRLTKDEIQAKVDSEIYVDVLNTVLAPTDVDVSKTEKANQKVEGKQETGENEDGLRIVYEIYTYLELKDDKLTGGDLAPYIITIDEDTERVLAIYRNWKEGDELFRKLDWFVEYQFIPWRGAYGIGLPHIIGGLSGAATGALRALLDSAHINNSASLVKLKSSRNSGKSITVEPTEIAEIEGPAGIDDIRKVMMAMPFNAPSPVLFSLLGWLTDAGKGVIATTEESMANIGDRTPVGTTMAMIEQGSATYSAIHARLHYSQEKALQILCRINGQYLEDEVVVEELDELVVSRADFQNSDDICPVSDPNIFSESQRFAQVQGIAQVRQMFPQQPFDENYIARMMLKRMRVEEIDNILPATKKPQNMNPVAENVAALAGTPLLAMPDQHHIAHIMAHLDFAGSDTFGNPIFAAKLLPIMIEHIKQHISFHYSSEMEKQTNFSELAADTPTQRLEDLIYAHQAGVIQTLNAQLAPVVKALGELQQKAAQLNPPPPADPSIEATKEVAMADIKRKTDRDNAELEIMRAESQGKTALEQGKQQVQVQMNDQDNKQHQQTELMKNHEDNLTNKWIAAMKVQQEQAQAAAQAQLDHFTQSIQAAISGQNEQLSGILDLVKHQKTLDQQAEQHQTQLDHDAEQSEADRTLAAEQAEAAAKQAAQSTSKE